jgi:hypothetical protein
MKEIRAAGTLEEYMRKGHSYSLIMPPRPWQLIGQTWSRYPHIRHLIRIKSAWACAQEQIERTKWSAQPSFARRRMHQYLSEAITQRTDWLNVRLAAPNMPPCMACSSNVVTGYWISSCKGRHSTAPSAPWETVAALMRSDHFRTQLLPAD